MNIYIYILIFNIFHFLNLFLDFLFPYFIFVFLYICICIYNCKKSLDPDNPTPHSPMSKDCLLQAAAEAEDFTFDLDIADHQDSLGFYDD